jgi:uroporphyrinogen-III synthase
MRILLTRPEADARKSAQALGAEGFDTLITPLFEIAPTGEAKPAGTFTALLATSAHAFDALTSDLSSLPLYVVGERTAEAAQRKGFHVAQIAADGENLARMIGQGATHFLYLAGRERRPELEAHLTQQGHRVTPWIVYETKSAQHFPPQAQAALTDGRIDAVLHFSTRSAALYRTLAQAAGIERQALAPAQIAISARAARELGGAQRITIATTPDLAGLISALKALSS